MSDMNLSPEKMQTLLNLASKKLGKDPETLRSALESGNTGELMQSLDPKSREKVNKVLSDPKALESLMQNEQMKNLLGKIMGGK